SSVSSIYTNQAIVNSWIVEPQLRYRYEKENNELEFLVGYSAQKERSEAFSQYAEGFATNAQIMNLTAANYIQVTDDTEHVYNYQALFGRANYTYNKKYFINITGRRDGSSRF